MFSNKSSFSVIKFRRNIMFEGHPVPFLKLLKSFNNSLNIIFSIRTLKITFRKHEVEKLVQRNLILNKKNKQNK